MSSLNATLQSVQGAAESAIASITGSSGDAKKAQETKDKAAAENELSHTAAKAGPFNVTPSGVSQDSPDRTQGQYDQTMGSAKQAIGGLVGSEALKQQGEKQRVDGEAQEAKGQLSDLGQSAKDRVTGTVGGAAAALTGDKAKQEQFQEQRNQGTATLRGLQIDADRKVEAAPK